MSAQIQTIEFKPYMTIKELAGYFGVCTKTIENWKRDGLLVYIQVRRVVRFDVKKSEDGLRNQGLI